MALPHVNAGQPAKAAEQNDLIDTVNGHTASLSNNGTVLNEHASRLSALEATPAGGSDAACYFGQWSDNNRGGDGLVINGAAGMKVTEINVAQGTPIGCRLSQGTLTVGQAGVWLVSASVQYEGNTSVRALWLSKGTAASNPSGKSGSVAGPSMDVQSADGIFRLAENESVFVYAAVWQSSPAVRIYRALSNNLTAVWLGP